VRRAVALGVVGVALVAPGSARAAGETVTLTLGRDVALHGTTVRFSGAVQPAAEGVPVQLFRRTAGGDQLLAELESAADGSYSTRLALRKPGPFVARAAFPVEGDDPVVVESALAALRIQPRLTARIVGAATVGHPLVLKGRLQPADAGKLFRRLRGEQRHVRVGEHGSFTLKLPTGDARPVHVRLRVEPAEGYTARVIARHRNLALPYLSTGSNGLSVLALERLLNERQYALRGVGRSYGTDTAQAVLAFQKVHGLARTGRMTPELWRRLTRSRTPKARVPRGDHIEISKTHQTIYEVRKGEVVNVIHTSTGATGNTPVGTFRVYYKDAAYNGVGMYYSLFFLRGFAIHGYHSVPAWPASHGCARIPLWIAPGLYSRWGHGTKIVVFP
jgi:L,D-transpeptidase catalytic domain/Putative peptidoglycan binding domain